MKSNLILIFLIFSLLALPACETAPTKPPLLPPGFEEAFFPNLPLEGFGYISQGQPLLLPGSILGLPLDISMVEAAGALFTTGTVAAWANLSSPETAQMVAAALPNIAGIGKTVLGTRVILYHGPEGPKLPQGGWVRIQEKVPQDIKLLWLLPSHPPAPPVAVGLTWVREPLLTALEESGTAQGKQLANLLTKARAEYVIGGIYAEKPLSLPVPPTISRATQMGVSFLLIAKSSYPLIGRGNVWKPVAQDIGFSKIDYGGQELFRLNMRGWDIIVGVKGSHIYMAGSPTLETAAALFASAINK